MLMMINVIHICPPFSITVSRRVSNYTRSLDLARPVTMVLAQSYASDLAASG